jgi:hypothetical protein
LRFPAGLNRRRQVEDAIFSPVGLPAGQRAKLARKTIMAALMV